MKRKSIFYEILYWDHLKIVHLLDHVHILDVSYYLWRHISSKKNNTLAIRRDLISSNTKKKHWKKKENRGEVGPTWSLKPGDVPCILKKKYFYMEKEVIMGVRVPYLYGSSLGC